MPCGKGRKRGGRVEGFKGEGRKGKAVQLNHLFLKKGIKGMD